MTKTYRIKAEVDASQALRSLGSIRSSLLGVGAAIAGAFSVNELVQVAGRFESLRVSLGSVFQSTERGAAVFDDIKRFAAESVFSVEDLTQTVIKLRAAGIEPTLAKLRLFADVSSVAADSVGALQAITDLYARTTAGGLGLEDLNRLADRGIPVFDILSKRLGLSRLEVSKFGQSAEGATLILQALEQGLQESFGGASAARIGTLNQSLSNLRDAMDNALDTIGQSGFNEELSKSINKLTEFIGTNQQLATTMGKLLGGAISFVINNIEILTKASIAFFAIMSVKAIKNITMAMALFGNVVGKNPIVKLLAGLATFVGTYAVVDIALQDLSRSFEDLNESTEKTTDGYKALEEGSVGTTGNLKAQMAGLNVESVKQVKELQKIGDEYKRNLSYMIEAVQREGEVLGRSIERQRIVDETAKIERSTRETLIALDERYNSLDKKAREERFADYQNQRNIILATGEDAKRIIADEITAVESYRRVVNDLTRAYEMVGTATETVFKNQVELALETNANFRQQIEVTERMNTLLEVRRILMENIANVAANERGAAANILNDIILTNETLNLSYDEQIAKIQETVNLMAEQGKISRETAKVILDGVSGQLMALKGVNDLMTESNILLEEQRRSWSFGWSKAMRDYVDDATNAARNAQSVFSKATQSMEDTIVKFAKTGKFEFRDFVNVVLEELLRIQIQKTFAQLLGGGSGSGGGGSILGSLFGGFFATGGMIPPGRFGVVGEAGPELVQGPADVTPLTGTSVTYNINAVDASSFKELLARDPSFLYAVTEQGRRRAPGTRR